MHPGNSTVVLFILKLFLSLLHMVPMPKAVAHQGTVVLREKNKAAKSASRTSPFTWLLSSLA